VSEISYIGSFRYVPRELVVIRSRKALEYRLLPGLAGRQARWSLGQVADDRTGATWAGALRGRDGLSFVTADAGKGLQAGIAMVRSERKEDGKPSLESGLDVLHTTTTI
jgi:hypothetical protein